MISAPGKFIFKNCPEVNTFHLALFFSLFLSFIFFLFAFKNPQIVLTIGQAVDGEIALNKTDEISAFLKL